MSKLKSIMMFTALAGMAMAENPQRYIEQPETPDERKRRLQLAEIKSNQAKGLKQFYNGQVWALNQKSADKKAKKLGII